MTRLSSSSSTTTTLQQPHTKKKSSSVVSMWMTIQLLLIWTVSAATAASFQSSITRKINTGLGRPTAFMGDVSLWKASSSSIISIRGGDTSDDESIDFDDESSDVEDSEDDEDSEDEDSEEEEEEDDEEDDEEEVSQQVVSAEPIKVMIKTNLGNTLVDQTLELQVSRNRNVASVKQSIMRQMPGRPPMSCQILMWGSQVLEDDQLVNELVDDEDEEEDEEEDDEDSELTLTLDVVPPIDPKFATEMMDRMKHMTTSQLLDAYLANQAGLYENARTLHEEATANSVQTNQDDDDDDEDDEDTTVSTFVPQPHMARSVQLRQEAYQMRQDLVGTFDEKVLEILEKDDAPSTLALQSNIERRGERIRTPGSRGGAKANVRRVLQKNLNINWPDTIRNFFLFLFFGLFGGRSTISKHLLLLGAPACFVLQVRPVKILVKQLFYTLSNPPGIFLTLMPAPQQAILSFDIDDAREKLYGSTTTASDAASQQNEEEEDMEDESSSSMMEEDDDSDSSDYDSDSEDDDNSDSEEEDYTEAEEYDSDY
eukprot:CAMPEP_0195283084 /NCGR_PEP_ID=MMETSP0707-20130614/1752_1 /TAXON_ID=33640 /ORGANISM="Asterionellopsis glacialis, Strain CCMP134" /LENGTH=539 /DNA_ID=CAMNT_0040342195 /DNA_START=142 /DNA_END=1761 /DNA_ORIENTATION=-